MPNKERHFPKIIREDEILLINSTLDKSIKNIRTPSSLFILWRDKTCINFLLRSGLRPKECLMLKWTDIDFDNRIIRIDPENNKERNDIPAILTNPGKEILLLYKEAIKDLGIHSEYIFPSYWTWKPITVSAFAKRFREVLKTAGILKFDHYISDGRIKYNYKLYSTRHKFCTDVYKKTNDTLAVKLLARHTQLLSAQFYVHLNNEEKVGLADKIFN